MRILKRNLAFVLVMAMAIGMMVTANAANVEDYRDANDIKFTEAVDVLTALGILEGEDGTFHPERTLTREEGAKIITYLMLGGDAADNLSTSVAPFADVAAGRWSAGYIAYCVSQGIVGGYGNGNFGPTDTLTGTQFAKMLLVALGYGVNGEYTGANWEIETNKQALTAGIYEGNLGVNFSNGVKREEAAQYAFNTLAKVMTVNYSDVFGAYYSGNIFDGKIAEDDEYLYTLGYNLYNLRSFDVDAGDDFGRACHEWRANSKTITGDYHDDADVVYTASVKASKIYADLGLTNSVIPTIIVDGEELQATADIDDDTDVTKTFVLSKNDSKVDKAIVNTSKIPDAEIGNGVIVEAYLTNAKDGSVEDVTLVVIHTYLAKVTDVDGDDVTVDFLTGDLGSDTYDTGVEYEEDDYVLVTFAKDEIQSMKPVSTVEGTLNTVSNNFVRFEGEQRNKAQLNAISKLNVDGDIIGNIDMDKDNVDTDNEYTLLVDDYGYALGLVLVEETENTTGYVYVNSVQGRNNNLLNSNAAVAEIRYLDGKGTEVLSLETAKKTDAETDKKVNCFHISGAGESVTIGNKTINAIASKLDSDGNVDTRLKDWFPVSAIAEDDAIDADAFFAYSINSNDELVLKVIDNAEGDEVRYIKNVSVDFNGTTNGTVDGVEKTVRFNGRSVVNVMDDDDKIKTYTGYTSIKLESDNANVLFVFDSENSTLVKEAYVLSADAKIGGNDDVFAYFRNRADDKEYSNSNGWSVTLYTDSTTSETYKLADDTDIDKLTDKGIYAITLNADNEISEISAIADYAADAKNKTEVFTGVVQSSSSSQFTIADENDDETTHIYGGECTIFDVTDGLKSVSTSALRAESDTRTGVEVTCVENEDNEVVYVIITTASKVK